MAMTHVPTIATGHMPQNGTMKDRCTTLSSKNEEQGRDGNDYDKGSTHLWQTNKNDKKKVKEKNWEEKNRAKVHFDLTALSTWDKDWHNNVYCLIRQRLRANFERTYLRHRLLGGNEWRAEQLLKHELFYKFAEVLRNQSMGIKRKQNDWTASVTLVLQR